MKSWYLYDYQPRETTINAEEASTFMRWCTQRWSVGWSQGLPWFALFFNCSRVEESGVVRYARHTQLYSSIKRYLLTHTNNQSDEISKTSRLSRQDKLSEREGEAERREKREENRIQLLLSLSLLLILMPHYAHPLAAQCNRKMMQCAANIF